MLNVGDRLKLILYDSENECIVNNIIAGRVYEVIFNGSILVLKWFDADDYNHYDRAYYDNLRQKCIVGSPNINFVWPINITDYSEQGFGYLMKKIPENFICMTEWESGMVQVTTQTLIRTALNLVYSLRSLGINGLCGADLHDGNIFFDPETGDLLIGDTDEIKPYGSRISNEPVHLYDNIYRDPLTNNEFFLDPEEASYFRYGMKRYQAPETVLDNTIRNNLSDRHSMSVLLFMLFYKLHPLEGKKTIRLCLSENVRNEIYGKNPLFVFDPLDSSNEPYEPISKYALTMWSLTPDYIKELFETAFSQLALKKPCRRPTELKWLNALARWDAEIERCDSCGNYFTGILSTINTCPICGNKNSLKYYVEFENNYYTVQAGHQIRKCLANITDDTLLLSLATFISKDDDEQTIGIKNCSGVSWTCHKNGKSRNLESGRIIKIFNGLHINTPFGDITVKEKAKTNLGSNTSLQVTPLSVPEMGLRKVMQREMLVLFVVDTSKSMSGEPINLASHFIEDILYFLQEHSKHQSEIVIKFSIMEFNTKISWLTGNKPISLEDEFEYDCPNGNGISDVGGALNELNKKLNRDHFIPIVDAGCIPPIIIFFTDGCEPFSFYGYDWEKELEKIQDNKWYRVATKIAVRTSEDSDLSVLAKLVGNYEAILNTTDARYLKHILQNHGILIS